VNTKDEEPHPKEASASSTPNVSQDSENPPSPAVASTSAAADEAKEQMTAIVLNSFGGLKNVKVGKRAIPADPPSEKHVNVKVIMR